MERCGCKCICSITSRIRKNLRARATVSLVLHNQDIIPKHLQVEKYFTQDHKDNQWLKEILISIS